MQPAPAKVEISFDFCPFKFLLTLVEVLTCFFLLVHHLLFPNTDSAMDKQVNLFFNPSSSSLLSFLKNPSIILFLSSVHHHHFY
mmetsp:Transcript_16216/g.24343  ORF Transcript_16216/g.24343 Transcript_16216/m.24343 type:complete len:84 (+) Transcript_16216:1318-1569(+)